jgi:hypothetical protein
MAKFFSGDFKGGHSEVILLSNIRGRIESQNFSWQFTTNTS